MYRSSVLGSKDFLISIKNGISLVKVNKLRATIDDAEAFEQTFESLLSANHNKIIIDFTECNYIDSVLIGIMVNSIKRVRKKGGDIFIVLPPGQLNILFARIGLYKIFQTFRTEEKAREQFSN